jgi:transposase
MEFKRVAIDTSKHVFTIHGVDREERPVLRQDLRRSQVEPFFAKLAPTEVVLEACGGSHHWARVLIRLGHRVRLIPPQYVKPFLKRPKNDRKDAEAINEAASRPSMRSVPIKTVGQQADAIIIKHREMLIAQRTQAINALRGHAAELGVVAAKGTWNVSALLAALAADVAIPDAAKTIFAEMGEYIITLEARLTKLDQQLVDRHKANPVSRLLAGIPGVGPITAITMAVTINAVDFVSGRHFAAWLGLTPREHSTGGRPRLGKTSASSTNCCRGTGGRTRRRRARQPEHGSAKLRIYYRPRRRNAGRRRRVATNNRG